jgi:hypothetical protein
MGMNVVGSAVRGPEQGVEPNRSLAFGFNFASAQEIALAQESDQLGVVVDHR